MLTINSNILFYIKTEVYHYLLNVIHKYFTWGMLTKSPPIVSGVSINDKLVPSHFDSFLSTSVGVFFVSSEKHSSIIGSFKYKCKSSTISK